MIDIGFTSVATERRGTIHKGRPHEGGGGEGVGLKAEIVRDIV